MRETSEYHTECRCGAPLVSPVRETKCDKEWLTPEGEKRKPCGRLIRFDWPIYDPLKGEV